MENETENNNLKPCPFCSYESISRYTNKNGHFVVQCRRCGAQIANYEHLPIDEWNTRGEKNETLETVHKFLLVVENRLECLIEYSYVKECDALELLKLNLDAALQLSSPEKVLPQFKDLAHINLTNGVDPTEYIRKLRG